MSSCSGNCSSCGSDCSDRKQESLLAPANPRSNVKKVIAVVSGKGGVGKSTVLKQVMEQRTDLGFSVSATTRGVIALARSYGTYSYTCIGCGRCDHACPKALSVCALRKFAEAGKFDMLQEYDVNMCIGCGSCFYQCPEPGAITIFEEE